MPWFYVFYKNTLFLISISWSLLYDFNTKIITFVFPLLPKSVCFVSYLRAQYVTVTTSRICIFQTLDLGAATKFYRWNPCTACHDGRQCYILSFIDCIMVFGPVIWCRVFAVILPWFLRFSQKFAVFFAIFAVIFYCPYISPPSDFYKAVALTVLELLAKKRPKISGVTWPWLRHFFEHFLRHRVRSGLSLETRTSNLKSVSLTILQLLAFNCQKFRGQVTLATRPFRKILKGIWEQLVTIVSGPGSAV